MTGIRKNPFLLCRIGAAAAVLAAVLGLCGCGRTVTYQGGIDYPYVIKEKPGGSLQISLDGSKTPGYLWECDLATQTYEQMDIDGNPVDPLVIEPPVTQKQKGSGVGGKGKYVIKPAQESGQYMLVYTLRRKDTTEPQLVYNSAGIAEQDGVDDYSARLSLGICVKKNEKGKLLCHVESIDLSEMTGVVYMAQDTPYGYSYQIGEDGRLNIRLPALADYEMSMEETDLPEAVKKAQQARIDQETALSKESGDGQTQTGQSDAPVTIVDVSSDSGQLLIESPVEEDYSEYDEETAEELRMLDEQITAYYRDYKEEIIKQMKADYYAGYGMVDDETAKESGRGWDQNPNLAVWKTQETLSADMQTKTLAFDGMGQGSVIFSAKSPLAGLTIRFVIDSDENGRLSVREATYEGGQTKNEKAFVTYVYEHGEDDTPDEADTEDVSSE
ncbi:MAG: hypothetical protein IK078_08205 [Lachnospiraceae bacterium]|nr:hypothetical protein [Lachnospiraceae bacterium]